MRDSRYLLTAQLPLTLIVLLAAAVVAVSVGAPGTAYANHVCADYPNQAAAQFAGDTIDADHDGIYCESLPCPCSTAPPGTHPSTPATPAGPTDATGSSDATGESSGSKCHYRSHGALPSRTCTPGKTNPDVKQSTINKTICKKGWTKTIRPPTSVTGPMKLKSMQEYGVGSDKPSDYEYDHLISLELGGSPDSTKNLWPEPHKTSNNEGSFVKDVVENKLKRAVCKGTMTLRRAQHIIRTDWTKAQQ
jgi:hypothetical protein